MSFLQTAPFAVQPTYYTQPNQWCESVQHVYNDGFQAKRLPVHYDSRCAFPLVPTPATTLYPQPQIATVAAPVPVGFYAQQYMQQQQQQQQQQQHAHQLVPQQTMWVAQPQFAFTMGSAPQAHALVSQVPQQLPSYPVQQFQSLQQQAVVLNTQLNAFASPPVSHSPNSSAFKALRLDSAIDSPQSATPRIISPRSSSPSPFEQLLASVSDDIEQHSKTQRSSISTQVSAAPFEAYEKRKVATKPPSRPRQSSQSSSASDSQGVNVDNVASQLLERHTHEQSYSNSLQGRSPNKVITYSALITMAILAMPDHKAKIHDIYSFIETHQNLVPELPPNWKLSVRHNLSSRPCFVKISDGCSARNSWWSIDEKELTASARLVSSLTESLRAADKSE